ncbi:MULTISPECIES: anti-sigma factor [Corynebacterium]|uniref:Anti-sigma factor n=2 Tax=Actinomycetes TaxID=1760 RepID=A0ABD4TMY3_9CORY|nr:MULTISPECIES: anti-sigma factor [Corynebacterium]MCQ4613684.1 anti-sigma factor [Corynebacterium pseudogenitalium]MDK8244436.1 anti-sigma factor [Corynebacterium sp. UMB10321]UUA88050.1 anti-sigma factor [Corynebacterium pseudogenitalium]
MDKDIEDLFNSAATPVTPPPELKRSIMERIDATDQVTDFDTARKNRSWRRLTTAAAAAVVLIAGGGFAVTQFTVDESRESVAAQGVDEMHAIMEADDARQGQADAMGASLDIAISSDMGKGGAMVNGQPALNDGMGAQVWAVMADGAVESAGVIGQEPHDDVWMPLPGGTASVLVTEEVAVGAAQPTGTVLANVTL